MPPPFFDLEVARDQNRVGWGTLKSLGIKHVKFDQGLDFLVCSLENRGENLERHQEHQDNIRTT